MNREVLPRTDGCWREIGRPGPGTCPELPQHVVCRNCPHYAESAARLLDRPAPPDYVAQWTDHLAAEPAAEEPGTTSAFVFRVGDEWFGLAPGLVEQISEPSAVHVLPHRRLPITGLVPIRGELVVCVSVHALLGVAERSPADDHASSPIRRRLVVLTDPGGRIAFVPSEVHGVVRYHPREVESIPVTISRASTARLTAGLVRWNGGTIALLDAGRFTTVLSEAFA